MSTVRQSTWLLTAFMALFTTLTIHTGRGGQAPIYPLHLNTPRSLHPGLRVETFRIDQHGKPLTQRTIPIEQQQANRDLTATRVKEIDAKMQHPPATADVPAMLYLPHDALATTIPAAQSSHNAQQNLLARATNQDLSPDAAITLGTFDDDAYLADLAIEYSARAKRAPRQELLGKVLRDRAIACQLAAQYPRVRFQGDMQPPPKVLSQFFPAIETFRNFDGNFAQRRLRSELTYCIDEAFTQFRSNSIADLCSGVAPTVLQLATTACNSSDPAVGFHLADGCFHLLEAGKYLAMIGRGVKAGTENFIASTLNFAKNLVQAPWDTAKECACNAVKLAGLAIGNALILSIENPTPWEREKQFELVDRAISLAKAASYNPEATIAFITEALLTQAMLTGGIKLVLAGAKSAGTALVEAAQTNLILEDTRRAFLKLTGRPLPVPAGVSATQYERCLAQYEQILHADNSMQPLASLLKAAPEQEKIFAAGGKAAEQIAKENMLLNPAGSALCEAVEMVAGRAEKTGIGVLPFEKQSAPYAGKQTLINKAQELFKTEAPPINFQHLRGMINDNKKFVGGHLPNFDFPGGAVEELGHIDLFGSSARWITVGNRRKYATVFPAAWNEAAIHTKIKEAWLNPIQEAKRSAGLVGLTSEGMPIEIWLCAAGTNGRIAIETAYPITAEKLAEIIKRNSLNERIL